ncbi:type 2 lanthipeptide synthetase LanM family protein [Agromyces aureus]|uniref:Lantibiotic biosynthesis protein dehydration domain-containing protein n=1 Tax=Agromyces aureus TaxID=453304 RepID=A0A191WBQ4_9MICO|nr:type 2 lanthipeptide synthetase LanM family protein [Agromyces aureus]ANJ25628.1 hypothetical protein ATC03_01475 [Agromyces aureus]
MIETWRLAESAAERGPVAGYGGSDTELASLRWNRWQQLPVFRDDRLSREEKVAPLGVTTEELLGLLGSVPADGEAASEGAWPDWLTSFRELWTIGASVEGDVEADSFGMFEVVRPLVLGAQAQLRERLRVRSARSACPEALAKSLVQALASALPVNDISSVCSRTMILEVNIAREEGSLSGATSEERFAAYVETLRSPSSRLEILREYPVMARAVTERLRFWIERSTDFAEAFLDDLPAIADRFWGGRTPSSLHVEFGGGDSHREGRSVAIVETDLGRVVYKPRRNDLDQAFDAVIAWFNSTHPRYELRAVRHVARDDHGWFEFVDGDAATDIDGADRYAWRLGALTALLHFLRATDFHYENIVAVGDHPIAVDLEALLHVDKEAASVGNAMVRNVATEFLTASVYSIGVLPTKLVATVDGKAVMTDISAIGARGDQNGIIAVPLVHGDGTDEVRMESGVPVMPSRPNSPRGEGERFNIVERESAFTEGFSTAFASVMDGKSDWLREGGLLDGFLDTRSRFISRPTALYGKVLIDSYHPDFMRDALDRTMCLGKLLGGYVGRPDRAQMIRAEIADLTVGDIPFFEVRASDGVVLHGLDDHEVGRRELAPLPAVREFVARTSQADLAPQLRVIRYTFASARIREGDQPSSPQPAEEFKGVVSPDGKRSAAVEVADAIIDLSVTDGEQRGWFGLGFVSERWWNLAALGVDLYSGTSGIAMALATIGEFHAPARKVAVELFDQLAETARSVSTLAMLDVAPEKRTGFDSGAFGLLSGLIYALSHGAVRYGDDELRAAAEELIPALRILVMEDAHHDVVAGNAGAILSLLSLAEAGDSPDALELSRLCATQLLAAATIDGDAMSWPSAFNASPLVGLSHGAVGVALALSRLREQIGDPDGEYTRAIEGALAFERQHHDPSTGDWADLRDESIGAQFQMRAWCHGSPGAVLARAELLGSGLSEPLESAVVEEIAAGVRATQESIGVTTGLPFGQGSDCLCHGDIGNLVIAETVARTWGERIPADREVRERAWSAILARAEERGWQCGIPSDAETPGLMTGLSGIAWGLAFSADPEHEPNILALEGPGVLARRNGHGE